MVRKNFLRPVKIMFLAAVIALALLSATVGGCQKGQPAAKAAKEATPAVAEKPTVPPAVESLNRRAAYDQSAQSVGHNVKLAQEIHFNSGNNKYTDQLKDLLVWDVNLTHDPAVTFIFGPVNASGYTFTTLNAKGIGKTFVFTH